VEHTGNRADGDIVQDFLSVADLLEEPQLAQLYAYLARKGEATVQDVMDDLEFAQGTATATLTGSSTPASSTSPTTSSRAGTPPGRST
jgi:hypothetical protein